MKRFPAAVFLMVAIWSCIGCNSDTDKGFNASKEKPVHPAPVNPDKADKK